MNKTLGFSIACYRGDIPLLRGCLASIKYFAPDAPICLIADGDFSTRSFEKHYNAITIRRADVKNKDLRKWSFGFGITKMVAFWEAPFDVVFHIDADAVLWGDVRRNLPTANWDVAFNEPHEEITSYIQNTQYFDPTKIFEFIPPFPWEGNPYFQAGIICMRKNALDLDEYLRLLELQRKHPDVFVNGDQGILNILVFRAAQAGMISALPAHLQTVVPVITKAELESRFLFAKGLPLPSPQPTVIHWAGPKPWRGAKDVFSLPMDYFRVKSMQECGLPGFIPTNLAMAGDEFLARRWPKAVLHTKQVIKRLIGRKS